MEDMEVEVVKEQEKGGEEGKAMGLSCHRHWEEDYRFIFEAPRADAKVVMI